ncbi:MAG: hypothetical protein JSR77_01230 [Planctomycetes bacterium]|nr:hypothetical protein [Planctomycetota bacterium]
MWIGVRAPRNLSFAIAASNPQPPPVPSGTSLAINAASGGPLSAEHLMELEAGRARAKKVRRAAAFATFSGWSLAIFATVTLVGALFGDVVSLLLGIGLGVAAFNEIRGGAMLRRFDTRGAALLGYNQLGLGAVIVVYAAWSMYAASKVSPLAAVGGSTGDADTDAMVSRVTNAVVLGLYGGLAVTGIVVPGLTAWYYFSRAGVVRVMVERTPAWVIAALRAAG